MRTILTWRGELSCLLYAMRCDGSWQHRNTRPMTKRYRQFALNDRNLGSGCPGTLQRIFCEDYPARDPCLAPRDKVQTLVLSAHALPRGKRKTKQKKSLATPVDWTNVAFQLGHGIGVVACTVHDVILLVPAMAELHFKVAVGDHGGSDVVLRADAWMRFTLSGMSCSLPNRT